MNQRFPIGSFNHEGSITRETREQWIEEIANLPCQLEKAVDGLSEKQLDTPYRDGGWTLRQVVHHIGDSHMNSILRFKLALTEEQPTIRPYQEELWAELADSVSEPVGTSLALIESIHRRWVTLLNAMKDEQFARTFFHPASEEIIRLDYALGMYAWHGRHHLAHISSLKTRMNWA
ncbi:YfiT family bacillithiol transferase [Paenibacillus sp. HB172176]|uniref:YfiT family bacillithiol transferase n=1 Tax=Paenibacillus sp. HB172176 TaxID=2493690 RepID=UPI00143A9A43|nr:bacillithiol transferase BstA [Paenibacillus sp. HB172176]